MTGPLPFDLYGPLPTGTTVLEASAGTGKTFTIAALAARYIAEGVADLGQLMMVTFGRMATDELRLRVRERLARSEQFLAQTLQGREPVGADRLDELLATGSDEVIASRRSRLQAALSDFDAATIATTHEFCQTMQAGLGVLGDHDPEATFAETMSDLTREVAADCYLRRFAGSDRPPPFSFEEARVLAEHVVQNGSAALVPALDPPGADSGSEGPPGTADSPVAQRLGFGHDVRAEVARRQDRLRLYSYDDMLTGLRDSLADPVSGPHAAERLRGRYQVVLVDEFQDTDPVQWDILRRAFHGHSTLILIGDPKQAIYAFRGADVYSYLAAVADADTVATLDVNWRSDAGLVAAQQALMGGAALGDPRIVVRPVGSAHPRPRLRIPGDGPDRPSAAPVRIRRREPDPEDDRFRSVGQWRPELATDLAADVVALLGSGAEMAIPDALPGSPSHGPDGVDELDGSNRPDGTGSTGGSGPGDRDDRRWRAVGPGDIAVLVRTNKSLETIKDALDAVGVPAVVRGARSVFCSDVAQEWRRLLAACDQPRQPAIRKVALTSFVGWDLVRLAGAGDAELTELSGMVRHWARMLADQGVAALLEAITERTGLASRLLAEEGGERRLTDLRHVAQSLHAAQTAAQLGVGGLLAWLVERIDEAERSTTDEMSRRLETDAEAVQILTIHRSKGLEFPVVYLPEAWDRWVPDDKGQVLQLRDHPTGRSADEPPDGGSPAELLDIGGVLGPGRRDRLAAAQQEEAGEDLRLYYVALTRARSQVVTWWLPSANTARSALQRFLFRARGEGAVPQPAYPVTGDAGGLPHLVPDLFSVETMAPRPSVRWARSGAPADTLAARDFDRSLDLEWRRTSYSALTAAAHGATLGTAAPGAPGGSSPGEPGRQVRSAAGSGLGSGVSSEPDLGREDDESAAAAALADQALLSPSGLASRSGDSMLMPGLQLDSPMAELPMGTQFGTVVHALLESVDPTSADLEGVLTELATAELARGPASPMTAAQLGAGLVPALQTPLGPLADERRLADIASGDRLCELTFELPLAGGDTPTAEIFLGDLVPLLRRHLGPDDPLRSYPELLTVPALAEQKLRGYLNGSIDAVLRLHDPGPTRYLVVDYKTNWLGDPDLGSLPVGHYTPDRMAQAMMSAHYPLQALLYSVALHRYLRWRQPGYEPEAHLGGVLYLFLRGMAGPDTPRVAGLPCGVFSWRPPAAMIEELSDLLDGRR